MKKMIISLLSAGTGAAIGVATIGKKVADEKGRIQKLSDKHLALFLLMNQWVKVKQEGKNLASYFEAKGFKRIAVYGMSYVGETFVDEIKDTSIEIAYGIDKNADGIYADIEVVSVDEELQDVDAVVVTAITYFDEIEKKLENKLDCPIVSLEDVLYEV